MLRVLSVDIGTVNYTCCAANFSVTSELQAKLAVPVKINETSYASMELVDVFNVDIGKYVKGLRALDVLIDSWDEFALFQVWRPDVVLIEQQYKYAVINYSMSITTYALSRKAFPGVTIKFVRPLNKFSGYKRFFNVKIDYLLKTYKQRKDAAVLVSTRILQDFFQINSFNELVRSEASDKIITKLDDCADAFLQLFCV